MVGAVGVSAGVDPGEALGVELAERERVRVLGAAHEREVAVHALGEDAGHGDGAGLAALAADLQLAGSGEVADAHAAQLAAAQAGVVEHHEHGVVAFERQPARGVTGFPRLPGLVGEVAEDGGDLGLGVGAGRGQVAVGQRDAACGVGRGSSSSSVRKS